MKTLVKIAVFAVIVMFGSSAFAGDPRCTWSHQVGNAVKGALIGLGIGDSGRAAGIGAAAVVGLQEATCATQSVTVRRTITRGGQGYQQPRYYDEGGYRDDYRRGEYYRPQPGQYVGPTDYDRPDPEPYYDANGFHCNRRLGLCKHASGTGYVYTMR